MIMNFTQLYDTIGNTRKFEDFFSSSRYKIHLTHLLKTTDNTFLFLYEDLSAFDPQLAQLLRNNPEEMLASANRALTNLVRGYLRERMTDTAYRVYVSTNQDDCPAKVRFIEFKSPNIGKLMIFDGIVCFCSAIKKKCNDLNYDRIQHITVEELHKDASCMVHSPKIEVLLYNQMVDTVHIGQKVRVSGMLTTHHFNPKDKNSIDLEFGIKANFIRRL